MTIAAIVLAAGGGSRFQGPDHKLLTPFRGRPVAGWAITAAVDAGFDRVYVVVGAVDLAPVVADVAGHVVLVDNPRWREGQATSLATGVAAADADGHDAVVVGLGDQPMVPASAWRSVGASAGLIVTATFDGRRRPPVKLDRTVWSDLPQSGDEGAKVLFRLRPGDVSELPCMGRPYDIDTMEDLERWS